MEKSEVLGNYQALFLNLLKADASVVLGSAGETDEVVTIDVRRQSDGQRHFMASQECA